MTNITLSTELINSILQYLGNRPYVEVANLISGVQKEAEAAAKPVVEEVQATETTQPTQE